MTEQQPQGDRIPDVLHLLVALFIETCDDLGSFELGYVTSDEIGIVQRGHALVAELKTGDLSEGEGQGNSRCTYKVSLSAFCDQHEAQGELTVVTSLVEENICKAEFASSVPFQLPTRRIGTSRLLRSTACTSSNSLVSSLTGPLLGSSKSTCPAHFE